MSIITRIRPFAALLMVACGLSFVDRASAQSCTTPAPLPYVESFNGLSAGAWPDCVAQLNASGTAGGGWTTGTLGGSYFSGPSAYVSVADAGPYDAWLFLPMVQLSSSQIYRLAYRYGTNSGSSGANNLGRMSVWYGSSATPAAMVNTIVDHGTFGHAVSSTHTDFSPVTTGSFYIGFRVNAAPFSWMTVVDDLSFGLRPACLEPSSLTATGPGFTDVQLSWACAGCTGPYIVEYGPAAVFNTPGTGTAPGANGIIASTTASSPFLLDGLAMGEDYRVFVRQNCAGGAGGNSAAVQFSTVLGNTLCGNAAELVCNDVVMGATHQAFSLPDISNYCDQSLFNTKGIWFKVEGNGAEYTVSSAPSDGGWSIGQPDLMLFSGPCGAQQCRAHAPWSASEDGSRITWVTEPGVMYYLYVYGENASVQLAMICGEPPSCFPPTALQLSAIGTNAAQVTWVNSAAPQYAYEVRTSGAAGSGSTGLVSSGSGLISAPLDIPGLQPDTEYVLYVRGTCAGNDLSSWTSVMFRTLCTATNVPYDGGFTTTALPDCYRVADVNGDGTWYGAVRPNSAYDDPYVARYGVAPGAAMADDWLITRGVNTVAGTTYRLTYKYSVISAVYPERMTVRAGNGAMPGQLTIPLADHPVITNNHNNVITNSVDITPGTGVFYVGFHVTSESNGWQLTVGDVRIEAVPTCLPPEGVGVSATTLTGATIVWQSVAGAVAYGYEVRTSGAPGSGAAGLVASGNTSGLSATIVGQLAHSTTYRLYVRADCGAVNGWSTWSGEAVFNTQCPATTVPYSEDFGGVANGDIPLCSVRATPGQVSPEGWGQWAVSTTLSGPTYALPVAEVITVEALNYDTWLFTRGLELEGGVAYRLTYRYGTNSGSAGSDNQGSMSVWLGTSPQVASMSQSIVDHGVFSGLVFDGLSDFVPPTTGIWYIGYRVHSAPSSRRVVLDDILVELAPTCVEPTDVVVLSGSGSTVQVNWTCEDCAGAFIVEYGPASVYTASGTADLAGVFGTISSSNATSPHFITGLATGENYRVFVRQVCNGDDYGLPSQGTTFSTPLQNGFCGQALPLVCSGSALGATANAPVWPNIQDFCGYDPFGTTGVWYRITGTGGTYSVSTCPGDGGANIGAVDLLVLTGQCNNFTCVALAEAGAGDCGGTQVQWEAVAGVQYHVWAIGNAASFKLAASCVAPPACPVPTGVTLTDLTTNSAQVVWSVVAGDTYDHELRTAGGPGSGATGLVLVGSALAGGPINMTDLAPDTDHVLYLRHRCLGGDATSEWVAVPFRTICTPVDVPYDGAFTDAQVPACFRVVDVGGNGTWAGHAFTLGGYADGYVARIGTDPGTPKDDWLMIQGLNTVAGESYRLSYKHSVISALYGERLAVYHGHAPVVAAMTELLVDHGTVTNTVPMADEVVFTPGNGPVYIGFKAYSLASGWQLYVGDIRVELAATCGAPSVLAYIASPTSVQVDWSCSGCSGEFYVEHGPAGFIPGAGATAGGGTLSGPFTGDGALIEGLTGDLGQWRFVVRRSCADGEFSVNSVPVAAMAARAVGCALPVNEEWCYGNNEDVLHRYIGEHPIVLQFTAGAPQTCCDHVHVYDGPTTSAPVLFSGNDLAGVQVGSTNQWHALTVRVVSDAGYSCADGSTGPLAWDVRCGSVGVMEQVEHGLRLFPNPTDGPLQLTGLAPAQGTARLQVLDPGGRVLKDLVVVTNGGPLSMDVSGLGNGPYLLRLLHRDRVSVHPFIKAD